MKTRGEVEMLIPRELYTDVIGWVGEKTMEHPSGIWGRGPMIEYLGDHKYIRPGQSVVDIGCGAGFPSYLLSRLVGEHGMVAGLDCSPELLEMARRDYGPENLWFLKADITDHWPIESGTADVVVSFMLCHNLALDQLQDMFLEAVRVLKPGGQVHCLTMHELALESEPWDLDFMVYHPDDLAAYKAATDKEGVVVRGTVMNSGGGKKEVCMINHANANFIAVAKEAGLDYMGGCNLYLDEATAVEKFGRVAVRKLPTTPTFWIASFQK